MDIKLTFVAVSHFGDPIYRTDKGRLIADMSPSCTIPSLYSISGNDVDDDPNQPLTPKADAVLVFIPERYAM